MAKENIRNKRKSKNIIESRMNLRISNLKRINEEKKRRKELKKFNKKWKYINQEIWKKKH